MAAGVDVVDAEGFGAGRARAGGAGDGWRGGWVASGCCVVAGGLCWVDLSAGRLGDGGGTLGSGAGLGGF